MDTKPPVPRAILVGLQLPDVDDAAHAASLEELGHLVKTLGYEVVGTLSLRRDGIGGVDAGKDGVEELLLHAVVRARVGGVGQQRGVEGEEELGDARLLHGIARKLVGGQAARECCGEEIEHQRETGALP